MNRGGEEGCWTWRSGPISGASTSWAESRSRGSPGAAGSPLRVSLPRRQGREGRRRRPRRGQVRREIAYGVHSALDCLDFPPGHRRQPRSTNPVGRPAEPRDRPAHRRVSASDSRTRERPIWVFSCDSPAGHLRRGGTLAELRAGCSRTSTPVARGRRPSYRAGANRPSGDCRSSSPVRKPGLLALAAAKRPSTRAVKLT